MIAPQGFRFFRRPLPSANMVLVDGPHPVLVDTGFGADLDATLRLLHAAGTPPERLALIVNTHYHADHSGGNAGLQRRHGLPVAAHRWEAAAVNARDPEACAAAWLGTPVEPYRVDRALVEGDVVETGAVALRVLHTPGHTLGHICLWAPEARVLLCGDAFHADDVGWLSPFREGAGALERALDSLDRLAGLGARWACSGHGPAIADPAAAIDAARRRYASWRADPTRLGWHALKRLFTSALMARDGLDEAGARSFLLAAAWFADYSRHVFRQDPADLVAPLLVEMVRSGAAAWRDGRLLPRLPYTPQPPGWPAGPAFPRDWPSLEPDDSARLKPHG